MESVYNFSQQELLAFALVLIRVTAFVAVMPVFGVPNVPAPVKVLFALLISFVIFPVIGWRDAAVNLQSVALITLAAKEIFVGLAFGFLSRAFFMALMMAGQVVSVSMGISSGQLFNPALGENSSAFDQFYSLFGALFFLTINGHHLLLSGITDTYALIGLGRMGVDLNGLAAVAEVVSWAMRIGVKVAAPVLAAILFVNVAMALVGRAVPQINILITSLPVNTLVGLIVVIFSLPILLWEMGDLVAASMGDVMKIMKSF